MKNFKRCRTKFGMTGKLAAVVLGAVLMAFPFASCNTDASGDEPNDTPTSYTISIADGITNGTVTASPTTATAGTEIKLTAEAASGYSFTSYNVTAANGNAIVVTDNKFTMPEGNVTVSATFSALPVITLSCDTPTVDWGTEIVGTVLFSNFDVAPETVDIYLEGRDDAVLSDVSVTGGTFTVDTHLLMCGTHNVYVKSGSAESNHISITINKLSGSISYATATVNKTTADEAFTNELTHTGNGKVTYYSSNTDVATVDEDGEVTIIGQGTATITATVWNSTNYTYATKTASYTLTVRAIYTVNIATGIENGTVTASPTTAMAGDTITLTVTPRASYELDILTVKDAGNADVTTTEVTEGESHTFTMPESNVTVTATFKRHEVSGKLGKYESPYEVGDIVFSDGSATSYKNGLSLTTEQKNAAIAIIFYTGTELNTGDDTSTSRTLGVGLKHSQKEWCTNSANAYRKNITTIQCPASGSAGALTFTGDKNGSDNLKQIATFLGTNNDTTEAANYPAFYFAENYGTTNSLSDTYKDGWYLPSIAELFQIYKNKATVEAASALCGGKKFGTNQYWSSSQDASDVYSAYSFNFDDDRWESDYKNFSYIYVCAVREF